MTNIANWKMAIEIVDIPMNYMVIQTIAMLVITRGYCYCQAPLRGWGF